MSSTPHTLFNRNLFLIAQKQLVHYVAFP